MTRPTGIRTIQCAGCGATVTGIMGNRTSYCPDGCAAKARKRNRPKVLYRKLAKGEALPEGKPLRYKTPTGYIMFRWMVSTNSYVEVAEHRVIDGRNSTAEHVHHKNFIRDDNRPENLQEVTIKEHLAIHHAEDRRRHQEMKVLYLAGKSTVEIAASMNADTSNVYRALVALGVKMRGRTDYAKPLPTLEIITRFTSGEGAGAIARDLGASYERVVRELESNGIQRRKVGRVPASAAA